MIRPKNMRDRLYKLLIAPKQKDDDLRNREVVLNTLLVGTFMLLSVGLILMTVSVCILERGYATARLATIAGVAILVAAAFYLSRTRHYRSAAVLLVGLYLLLAAIVAYQWGVITPTGTLLFGLVIVLSGILLGPTYALYMAAGITLLLFGLQLAAENGLIRPDWSWLTDAPAIGDVLGSVIIFAITALVSWLFNYLMEKSLHRAITAEAELRKQKSLLEIKVQERTRELQAAQLEKVRQMYRFAELGQLSTALMHDLANHLTSLTLDIEGLQGQGRSRAVSRAKRSIRYIDDMVVRVREQLHGKGQARTFGVVDEVDAIVKMLRHKAQAASVSLEWQPPAEGKNLRITGEPVRLRQLMANLVSNGIDAYYALRDDIDEKRVVEVQVADDEHHIIITVNDWGRGIPKQHCAKLFEPFFSTKQTGMGMGLYIARQVAVEHFLGDIKVANPAQPTSFVVTLPRA